MSKTDYSKLKSVLGTLSYNRLIDFELQIQGIWYDVVTKGVEHDQRHIDRSIEYFESSATDFVSEGVQISISLEKTPEAFAILNDVVVDFLSSAEGIVKAFGEAALAHDASARLDSAQLQTICQRVERRLEGHRGKFAEVDGIRLVDDKVQSKGSNAGRKTKYNWPEAVSKCWSLIYLGTLKVDKQKDIESWLIDFLSKPDDVPTESTVRPYAKLIFQDLQYDPMDEN